MSTCTTTRRTRKATKTASKSAAKARTKAQSKKTASKNASRASKPKGAAAMATIAPSYPTFDREKFERIKNILGEMEYERLVDMWMTVHCGSPTEEEIIEQVADELYGLVLEEEDMTLDGLLDLTLWF